MPEPAVENYTIGWICALQEEYEAACQMLDDELDGPESAEANDNNTYMFGRMGAHNVVIGSLPLGRYGTSSAASVAKDMVRSFPKLRFALMVGIGGGAPTEERDIRLGDVVVSVPQGTLGGVVQYDFGKRLSNGRFQQIGQLNAPPNVLLGAIPEMRRRHNNPKKPDRIADHIKLMEGMPAYRRPTEDRLYHADYEHKGGKSCADCKTDGLKERQPRESSRAITVHYGIIASANSVMKNAKERDQYATDPELNVLCFEMEAGGLMNNFPCLVIRGICDYSDSHKNDDWHNYAALTAAAYARELLDVLKPVKVAATPSWAGRMETTLASIQAEVSAASIKTDQIIDYHHTQEHQAILDWLTPIDHALQQSHHFNRRQARTGQWLLHSPEFKAWVETDKQTLFCPGIPGAGKTILTSIVVNDLTTRFLNDKSTGFAYLYCDLQRQGEQKAEDLLASLLKQLAQCCHSLPDGLKSLNDCHKDRRTRPSFDDMWIALQSVSALFSRVFIAVDALDECQVTDCRTRILSKIFDLQAKCRVKFFATSRCVTEIAEKFEGSLTLPIRATKDDLEIYLADRMACLQSFVIHDPDLQKKIQARISEKADGMFLFATRLMDCLAREPTKGHLNRALDSLPKELNDTYEQAMGRIESLGENSERLAKKILSWVIHAKRLLSITEIRTAVAVEPGQPALESEFIPTTESIGSLCAGLITIDTQGDIVRLVHQTTKEYFDQTKEKWFQSAEADIATVCVTYLSFSVFESGLCQTDDEFEERLRSNPLYDYAAHNWGHHARAAPTEVQQLLLAFLENKAKVSSACQPLMAYRGLRGYSQGVPRQIAGVYLAALFGLKKAIVSLLQNGPELGNDDTLLSAPEDAELSSGNKKTSTSYTHSLSGTAYDEMITDELEKRWILSLSMRSRDRPQREKFIVAFAESPTLFRRVTISLDYRKCPEKSLEAELFHAKFLQDKSARIYEAIRESLPDIQFYDTVTNLKLSTVDNRLHVHVVEDLRIWEGSMDVCMDIFRPGAVRPVKSPIGAQDVLS